MNTWEETKKNIHSLSISQIEEIEAEARAVVEAESTSVNTEHPTKTEYQDYNVLRVFERDCPICDKVHTIEKRKRLTKGLVKNRVVDYEEIYYHCSVSDEEENEFVSAGLMDENLLRARNAYAKSMSVYPEEERMRKSILLPKLLEQIKTENLHEEIQTEKRVGKEEW